MFNHKIFFDEVRHSLFGGSLTQQQVDGMSFKLKQWEDHPYHQTDLRWLSYPLATSMHETASTMWPIEEYGKGQGQSYGVPDPETGQTYYGRGDVQLTWRDNYKRAASKLGLTGTPNDLEWHAEKALDPKISADVMFMGMSEGWFRTGKEGKPQTLSRYFSETVDDPYTAREIINGDKSKIPNWSNGVSIGNLIKGYHSKFLEALRESLIIQPSPPEPVEMVALEIQTSVGVGISIHVNGVKVFPS